MLNRILVWQIGFVCGLTLGVVIAAITYGATAMTAVFGMAAVIVALVNGLTGAPQASTAVGGTVGLWARRVLNIGPVLKVATVIVWALNVTIAGYWTARQYRISREVFVKGTVLTSDGVPANNALVTLVVGNTKTSTVTPNGLFSFAKVDSRARDCSIHATWMSPTGEALQGTATVMLRDRVARENVPVRLRPGRPPFNFSFLTLKGHSIDLLVRNQLPQKWLGGATNGRTLVARTAIYDTLAAWTDRYTDVVGELSDPELALDGSNKEPRTWPSDELPLRIHRANYLVATAPPGRVENDFRHVYDDVGAFKRQLVEGAPWIFHANGSATLGCRLANAALITAATTGKTGDLFSTLSHYGLPNDFAVVRIGLDECALEYFLELQPRLIQVRVAVLEATQPIVFGSLQMRVSPHRGFRTPEDTERDLAHVAASATTLLPASQALRQGDTVVVPLQIQFEAPQGGDWESCLSTDEPDVAFPLGDFSVRFLTPLAMKKGSPTPTFHPTYIFGDSLRLDNVVANGQSVKLRKLNDTSLYIEDPEVGGGSCPIVYSKVGTNSWSWEGPIISGHRGPSADRLSVMRLRHRGSVVRISEEEPETSYIDMVALALTFSDGTKQLCLARNPKIRRSDGEYLVLRQGDKLELEFDPPQHLHIVDASLQVKGYYVARPSK